MRSLDRNFLFLGTHREERVALGDYTFLIVSGGSLKEKTDQSVEVMQSVVPAYEQTFDGPPHGKRYLVVINAGDRADGGAFDGSYSMLIQGRVNEASRAVWGHGIAHEVLHFWNGQTLMPASPKDEAWFKEGFTDYLTTIVLSRAGIDPREVTFRKLENFVSRYTTVRYVQQLEESLRDAGVQKHRMHTLVYGGGARIAFALDIRIREATGNTRGLDDLMAAMYEEFAKAHLSYGYEDIVRVVSEASGEDQSDFFAHFVAGTEFLDAAPYFEAAGLQLYAFMDIAYLSVDVETSEGELAIGEVILGPSRR